MQYDSSKHLLLWDVAHMRCIHDEAEYQQFISKVREAGIEPYEVDIPDWPPAYRQPLPIIIMSLDTRGDGEWQPQGGPTSKMTWSGTQLAIDRDQWHDDEWTEKQFERVGDNYDLLSLESVVKDIAKELVPNREEPMHRVGYAWQVPVFDPEKHVVIRYWCDDNNVDIVDFWLSFYRGYEDQKSQELFGRPYYELEQAGQYEDIDAIHNALNEGEFPVITTVNPRIYEEQAEGSFSPTRRCIPKSHLYLLRNEYLGTNEEPPAPADDGIEPQPKQAPLPQPRLDHDSPESGALPVEWNIHEGVKAYPGYEVIRAIEEAVGRDVRPFSGTTLDQKVVAIKSESMIRYLVKNPINRRQYILDSGGRNYDCDDFALSLRTSLIREHGYNCVGVIAGDVHAWNFFVLVGKNGPKIAFVEPQTDGMVPELTGDYSIENRCEVII